VRAGAVLFAAVLTGAAAQLAVTVPWTAVPFTLQPVAVVLAGAVLGARLGALSQTLYLALGVTGAAMFALSPVLAPGVARLVGPTGGFLLAFPLAAFATGWLADRGWTRSYAGAVAAMLGGLAVLYAGGGLWLAALAGPSSLVTLWAFAAADLVKGIRKPFVNDIKGLRGVAGNLAKNKGEVDRTLQVLPIKLEKVGRTAIYGSWFNFYLCQFTGQVTVAGKPLPVDYQTNSDRCSLP